VRDTFGLRFALLAELTGPAGRSRTYLFDVDLCHGFYQVLDSGYHADVTTAAAAWRTMVGASADGAEPQPAPDDLLPDVLPGGGVLDGLFGKPLSDSGFTELYRADGVVAAVTDALAAVGRPVRWRPCDVAQAGDLATDLVQRFRKWADLAGLELPPSHGPDDDPVGWLVHDWVQPRMGEGLALACSPHRIAAFTAYLIDDWLPEQRAGVLELLYPWATFCLECSGVTGPAADLVLTWAERAAREPDVVGADLGNNLNRRLDETTLTGPPLPVHAR
jgi:hypothetical protein